jgi:glycosyltransferase involved in cell wall biosynthesis
LVYLRREEAMSPLVSVCVPTYNYGRFLPDCIESVGQQTLSDWELIITDDCSSDDTEELVSRYAAADSRIRYIRNPVRLGMNANLKRAAESGKGRYRKILCADDWMAPRCLEVLCDLMEAHPQAVLATSAVIQTDEVGTPVVVEFLFGESVTIISGEKMLNRMAKGYGLGGNSSFLLRASAYFQAGGFDANLVYAADYDLAARLCRLGDYIHTDTPLFYGRTHEASSSSVNPKNLLDVIDYFTIPEKVFQPRHFPNREWRRYQQLTSMLTARYLFNLPLQFVRGHRTYARGLADVLRKHGNFALGIPYLPAHVAVRIYRRLTRLISSGVQPEPWMGPPNRRMVQ